MCIHAPAAGLHLMRPEPAVAERGNATAGKKLAKPKTRILVSADNTYLEFISKFNHRTKRIVAN